MSMIDQIRKEEEHIAQLEKELAAEDKAIEERKAAGEQMNTYRWHDLAREIRRRKRELRQARRFHEQAKREKEIAAGERMTFAEMIAEARRMKEKEEEQ